MKTEPVPACPACQGTNTRRHCGSAICTWLFCHSCRKTIDLRKATSQGGPEG